MKRIALAACAAGTMLVASSPSAFADGWQPSTGNVTIDAVNPCTGSSTQFAVAWDTSRTKAGKDGSVRTSTAGTYTASDGSTGSVRTTATSSPTKDGYSDSYRQVLIGTWDGRPQRITFIFRVAVGQDVDVKVERLDSACGG